MPEMRYRSPETGLKYGHVTPAAAWTRARLGYRLQAIAEVEAVTGNAARLVRAPTLCLCKAPGEGGAWRRCNERPQHRGRNDRIWVKGAAGGAVTECDSWRPAAGCSVDRRDRGVCADAVRGRKCASRA